MCTWVWIPNPHIKLDTIIPALWLQDETQRQEIHPEAQRADSLPKTEVNNERPCLNQDGKQGLEPEVILWPPHVCSGTCKGHMVQAGFIWEGEAEGLTSVPGQLPLSIDFQAWTTQECLVSKNKTHTNTNRKKKKTCHLQHVWTMYALKLGKPKYHMTSHTCRI